VTEDLYTEWYNQNEHSKYPFADGAALANSDNDVIPKGLLLDAHIYPSGGGVRQFLSRITTSPTEVVMAISDASGELASGSYSPSSPPDSIALTDVYGRPAGILVGGQAQLAVLAAWAPGDHLFTVDQAELTATAVVPVPDVGVRGVVLESGEIFTGDVWLVGEDGVVVTKRDQHIRVDVVGDPYAKKKYCGENNAYSPQWFLQSINGIHADPYGDFKFLPGSEAASDTILRVEKSAHGLVLSLAGVGK